MCMYVCMYVQEHDGLTTHTHTHTHDLLPRPYRKFSPAALDRAVNIFPVF